MAEVGPSWTTIAMVLFVIIGCILVVFLGYMVRSAYDLRIGLKAQMDRGLKSVEEDGAKKARALRQELGTEIERTRGIIIEDARRRLADSLAAMEARQAEFESTVRQERIEMAVTLDVLRDEFARLGQRINELERELLVGGGLPEPPVVAALTPANSTTPPPRAAVASTTAAPIRPPGPTAAAG
jgi:Tfp pilus assembly protein PilO